ncbi:MAG: DUF2313 domain-containing protein [Lachnospiraceae bacterium]|nr:DUF2313 domain-containing protein [Lachnospiraceae bacterium]
MGRQLIGYYPEVLRGFAEYQVLAGTEQEEIDRLWKAHRDLLADQFVTTATENGVRRWEKILGVMPRGTATMEERRFFILSRLAEELPYTMSRLRQQMEALCGEKGFDIVLRNEEYLLVVRVALTARSSYEDVNAMLRRVVPANMVVDISLLYNQHGKLGKFTHGQMAEWTQYQLRNEVLPNGV